MRLNNEVAREGVKAHGLLGHEGCVRGCTCFRTMRKARKELRLT